MERRLAQIEESVGRYLQQLDSADGQKPSDARTLKTTTLPRVASCRALHVLAYNLTRVMNIMGIQPLMAAIRA